MVDGTKVTIKPPGAMSRKERKAAAGGVLDIETVDEAVDMAEVGAVLEADAGVSKTAAKKKKKSKAKRKN